MFFSLHVQESVVHLIRSLFEQLVDFVGKSYRWGHISSIARSNPFLHWVCSLFVGSSRFIMRRNPQRSSLFLDSCCCFVAGWGGSILNLEHCESACIHFIIVWWVHASTHNVRRRSAAKNTLSGSSSSPYIYFGERNENEFPYLRVKYGIPT